jgi:hypothetical protein
VSGSDNDFQVALERIAARSGEDANAGKHGRTESENSVLNADSADVRKEEELALRIIEERSR